MPVLTVAVTITGSGNGTCYVIINGTQHYSGTSSDISVMPGDIITFSVKGYNSAYPGELTIDGERFIYVTTETSSTYDWKVPYRLKSIKITMSYFTTYNNKYCGEITVTTA